MHFREPVDVRSIGFRWHAVSISSGDGLTPNMWQAIINTIAY